MITQEKEIEIDEKIYIPHLTMRKHYRKPPRISVAIVIDFEEESVEIQRTITGTSFVNHSGYDMSADTINDGYPLFARASFEKCKEFQSNLVEDYDIWYVAEYSDIAGNEHKSLCLPEDDTNPMQVIIQWIKNNYKEFNDNDVMEF